MALADRGDELVDGRHVGLRWSLDLGNMSGAPLLPRTAWNGAAPGSQPTAKNTPRVFGFRLV